MRQPGMKKNALAIMQSNPDKWFPVYYFWGELHIPSENRWVFFSHKTPARITELFQEGYLERELVKGQSGARYYKYKFKG